jgi:hypothetical protein
MEGGGRNITQADNGGILILQVGERFLLKLGEGYDWTVEITDQTVLQRVIDVAIVKDSQGVYEAINSGQSELKASGDPLCRKQKPPCGMPSIQFQMLVKVN